MGDELGSPATGGCLHGCDSCRSWSGRTASPSPFPSTTIIVGERVLPRRAADPAPVMRHSWTCPRCRSVNRFGKASSSLDLGGGRGRGPRVHSGSPVSSEIGAWWFALQPEHRHRDREPMTSRYWCLRMISVIRLDARIYSIADQLAVTSVAGEVRVGIST